MNKFFLFRKESISLNSVTESDNGVGLSVFSIHSSNLAYMSASIGRVYLVFNDAGVYENVQNENSDALKKTTVTVSCKEKSEHLLIENILNFINSDKGSIMKFDSVDGGSTFNLFSESKKDINIKVRTSPDQLTVKTTQYKVLGNTAGVSSIDGVNFAANQYPIFDLNPTGLTGWGENGYEPNWQNSSESGVTGYSGVYSYYFPSNHAFVEFQTGRTVTGLSKRSVSFFGPTATMELQDILTLEGPYTFYVVLGIPASNDAPNLTSWPSGQGLNYSRIGVVAGDSEGSSRLFSNITNSSVFSVGHSNNSASSVPSVSSVESNDSTVYYPFPRVDQPLETRQTCYVFVIRRDDNFNLYLHNHEGNVVAFIPSQTNPNLNNRTDGNFILRNIGSYGLNADPFTGFMARIGAIQTDVGPSEAARIAQELYENYNPTI